MENLCLNKTLKDRFQVLCCKMIIPAILLWYRGLTTYESSKICGHSTEKNRSYGFDRIVAVPNSNFAFTRISKLLFDKN